MCADLGCYLMTRDNNDHAKAGNINHALIRTPGELVLILDCDHIPTRNILQETVGFFVKPSVSLVQTPHWFYNPDPFERNLLTQGKISVGNELFYKVLQKGNDFWNASFFYGSAAVVRKSHLLEVGGIAVETVTEDCHTSLRLHGKGYETVYYDKIMVAGLAPEKFSAYVGQQVRWAQGMAQILRLEWPIFNRTLTIPQRICYTSATTHFFFGFPRLMYAIAPIAYSGVDQWYSQVRTTSDRPLSSIRFLMTSLLRVFHNPEPSTATPVFKQVSAPAQIYSHGHYLDAVTYAINSRGLRAVLQHDHSLILHPEIFGQGEPVGLTVEVDNHEPVRLVAQLDQVKRSDQQTTLELGFPKVLDVGQSDRIQLLMLDFS